MALLNDQEVWFSVYLHSLRNGRSVATAMHEASLKVPGISASDQENMVGQYNKLDRRVFKQRNERVREAIRLSKVKLTKVVSDALSK